jgi:hypothetical protein
VQVSEEEILDFLARWSLFQGQLATSQLWDAILVRRRDQRPTGLPPLLPESLAPPIQALRSVVLVLGGYDQDVESTSLAYNPAIDACTHLEPADLPFPWANMAAVYHAGAVYLCGGESWPASRKSDLRQFWRLCLDTLTWSQLPSPAQDRNHAALAVHGGHIYVFGGQDSQGKAARTAERFDIIGGEWSSLPDMEENRTRSAALTLNDKIYVIGGSDGNNDLSSVAVLDPAAGQWSRGRRLPAARSSVRAAVLDGCRVLVAGGTSSGLSLRSCITADVVAGGRWKAYRQMVSPRRDHSLASVDGRFVVAVGGSGPGMELLSLEQGGWETLSELAGLEEDRTGAAACTIPMAALGQQLTELLHRSWTQ